MKYKAIVLDLDGTLMTSQNTISPRTKEVLINLQKEGIKVILASGRPTHGMMPVVEELALKDYNGYILSYNGGKIISLKEGVISETSLDIPIIHQLYRDSIDHKTGFMSYGEQTIYTPKRDPYIEIESKITRMQIEENADFHVLVNNRSVKCLMTGEPEYLQTIESVMAEKYQDQLSVYRSMPFFLELMPKGIDKGQRLIELANHLNIDRKEIIACGDGYNDISMIEVAGVGVAMGNGCEAIKKQAKYITATNDNDGIVEVIERFFYQ
jgi:Cof subfamily protein (haloacid dehalogenase superfamily)